MTIGIEQIRALLPHSGTMCLLEEVDDWSASRIVCRTQTHRRADNPLRSPDGLGSAIGVEYAAQAMALHAGLVQDSERKTDPKHPTGQHGVIASVRNVKLFRPYLHMIESDLIIEADLLSGDVRSALYDFQVGGDGQSIVSGRATVVLVLDQPTNPGKTS